MCISVPSFQKFKIKFKIICICTCYLVVYPKWLFKQCYIFPLFWSKKFMSDKICSLRSLSFNLLSELFWKDQQVVLVKNWYMSLVTYFTNLISTAMLQGSMYLFFLWPSWRRPDCFLCQTARTSLQAKCRDACSLLTNRAESFSWQNILGQVSRMNVLGKL